MRTRYKTSTASYASVRTLIVACMPVAVAAFSTNTSAFGTAGDGAIHSGLTIDDNSAASSKGSNTNGSSSTTNNDRPTVTVGIRG